MNSIVSEPKRPFAHAITDIDGRFLAVDDRFCELVQRERSEVLDHTIMSLTAEEHRPLNADKLEQLRDTGASFVIRKTYLRADGAVQPVENTVSLLRDGLGSAVLTATVSAQHPVPSAGLVVGLTVARLLLRERNARISSGLIRHDEDLALLLSAYVLETEGAPVWAADLAEVAGGDGRANLLRIWELVNAGVFVVDGKPSTLEKASIRLSPDHIGLVERHLANVSA